MKVVVAREELLKLIGKVQAIVPMKPTLPILANILLEAQDDQLTISATDLTVSMRAFIEAKVSEEGSVALPAKRFFQLVRELTTPSIEIECKTPDSAFINSGTSHFKLSGMQKTEFPAFPDLSQGRHWEIDNSVLKEMLSRTSFAAARDDNRQVLNGILLQSLSKMAVFTGTDGKRLARLQTEVPASDESTGSYIMPLKAVEEIIKMLDLEKTSKVTLMQDKVALETGPVTLISKLLTGQYPDVGRVIPKQSQSPILLHREELMSLLRQIALFTTDQSSAVRFSFHTGELHLSAMSGDIGEGKVSMAVNYGGPKLDVAFNPHYFLDILRHSRDETVALTLTDSFNPGLVTDSTEAQFVIMPMRLES